MKSMISNSILKRLRIIRNSGWSTNIPCKTHPTSNGHERIVRFEEKSGEFGKERFYYRQGGKVKRASGTWYRGENCNFIPTKANLKETNAIKKYILQGWLPEQPFITKTDYITSFGSCFAKHITNFLKNEGYNLGAEELSKESSYVMTCGEGMVNTFAIRQQFEWAYEGKEFTQNLWHDSLGAVQEYLGTIKETTAKIFEKTDIFIITLGLSEVWYDKESGNVFWRAIPRSKFDPQRHGFKVTTVQENRDNLERIYDIIRRHRPTASIILTLSPVPLVATFRKHSCITANSVSKAVLRAAVDEFTRSYEYDERLFYFPSYELVNHYFKDPYQEDNRHIRLDMVNKIMNIFSEFYLIR
jgi:hypothetical protein